MAVSSWPTRSTRRLRWAYTAWFVVPALLVLVALEVVVATHLPVLAPEAHVRLWLSVPVGLAGLILGFLGYARRRLSSAGR